MTRQHRKAPEKKYGVRWSQLASKWEVSARGEEKPTYHDDLPEAMSEYHLRAAKRRRNVTAGDHIH